MFNSHLETIIPYLMRRVQITFERERFDTPDGDFIDVDWACRNSDRLAILCHGLEGTSQSQYMCGMTQACHDHKWDVLALNFRSCSSEINRSLKMYHHGDTSDLKFLIDQVVGPRNYADVALIGFSLGGNVVLKYLGTEANIPNWILGGSAISVPGHLSSSSAALDEWQNTLYTLRFRRSLKKKLIQKSAQFPDVLPMDRLSDCKTWREFDHTFTTIINSFESADEYYEQGSANNYLEKIEKPALIINAWNDPFLRLPSYPIDFARKSTHVVLETPTFGGHVGFWKPGDRYSYAEIRSLKFFESISS